jgi:transcriptional regulator with XRE-family HTH domain
MSRVGGCRVPWWRYHAPWTARCDLVTGPHTGWTTLACLRADEEPISLSGRRTTASANGDSTNCRRSSADSVLQCGNRIRSDTLQPVGHSVLTDAREAAGLSKTALAARAHTSRSTLSAYEHGRVSPTLATAERILAATGHRLRPIPIVTWHEVGVGRGRTAWIPDRLPDLPATEALRTLTLPLDLEWSRPGRTVRLSDRGDRARAYEMVLREGTPAEIESIVDGVLLVDVWDQIVLPRAIRPAWQVLIDEVVAYDG